MAQNSVNALNALATAAMGLLLQIFGWTTPSILLACVGALSGLLLAWVYRHASNQTAIRRIADCSRAELLAIRLFRDDLNVALRCQITLLKLSLLRVGRAAPPLAVAGPPMLLLMVQLTNWCEYRPLTPGESTIVQVQFAPEAWQLAQDVEIEAPGGVQVETPPLRDEEEHRVSWRIKAIAPQSGSLRWRLPNRVVEKRFDAADGEAPFQVVSVRRAGPGVVDRLLHPLEPAFARGAPIQAIELDYPTRPTVSAGWRLPWWATFFLAAFMGALLGKHWWKTEF